MSSSVGISVTGVQKLAVEAVSAAIQLILETPAAENKTKIAALETLQKLTAPQFVNISGCSVYTGENSKKSSSSDLE